MTDLVDRIRKELDARLEQLRPLVEEFERLQRAAAALARSGARAVPGVGVRPPAPVGRAGQPARRRASATPRTPASEPKTAGREHSARRGTRRRGTEARAARGQTQEKVLAALRQGPGSTTAAIASATGIPAKTASATISRLVKQGRVRRLHEGGFALAEAPADGTERQAAPVTTDAGQTPSDSGDRTTLAQAETPTPETPRD